MEEDLESNYNFIRGLSLNIGILGVVVWLYCNVVFVLFGDFF